MSNLRFKYQTIEFGLIDIHVKTLRSKQEYYDKYNVASNLGIHEAVWSLFGVIWPSSKILAHHMHDFDTKNKKILEVGCGMALTSLMLNHRDDDISATDYHPEVESFLEQNTLLNHDKKIPYIRIDWEDTNNQLGTYDLIIGSDLLYQPDHINLLSSFINRHANQKCEVIIVDPGRGNYNKFSKNMVDLGFVHTQYKPENTQDYLEESFKGKVLIYTR